MSKRKPNVLFILTDDQRAGTISALGNSEIHTPNMDRLCSMGTAFTHAYIPGGTTGAVCMPSRAMINSGRSLFHILGNGKEIPEEHITMGENFLAGGYHSCGIGKWHNGPGSYARSFDGGAEIFFGGMWDHWNVPVNDYHADGVYEKMIAFTPNFTASGNTVEVRAEKISAGVHSTELFTRAAADYIKNYSDDKPFFLYLSLLAPHDPRTMPEKFRGMYRPEDITLPPNFSEMPLVNYGWSAKGRDETLEAYPRRPERIKQHICDYYAMISHIDFCLGGLIDTLESKGMLDNTIIVLCGDNGLALGQHGLMGKQNIYEHSVGVPLIFCGPGVPAGRVEDRFVYLFDVYPTLCELCGIKIPESVEGKSFAGMFGDGSSAIREDLYFAFQARIRGVRDRRYKLIEYRTEDLKLTQLFDLETDPWERYNFYDIAGYEEITARLRARLFEYRDEWEDEAHTAGKQFWQAFCDYEAAAPRGVSRPKGASLAAQLATLKKS
jgi:arylsulfatase A-like enzyme